jgi:hypothetical protein
MVHVGDALKEPMRLLTSQRVNLLEVSQEQGKLGDGRLADVNSALEIESRPYGWSSLKQDGSSWWVSPSWLVLWVNENEQKNCNEIVRQSSNGSPYSGKID